MLVAAGGFAGDEEDVLSDVEIINLNNLNVECSKPPNLPVGLLGHVAAVIEDKLTICGGQSEEELLYRHECLQLDISSGSWLNSTIPPMHDGRMFPAATMMPYGMYNNVQIDGSQ